MTQVPARALLWVLLLLIGIGFWAGVLYWNKQNYKCFQENKHFYGEWVTVLAISKFEIRVKPFGCPEGDRYDPRKWRPIWEYTSPTPLPKTQP